MNYYLSKPIVEFKLNHLYYIACNSCSIMFGSEQAGATFKQSKNPYS